MPLIDSLNDHQVIVSVELLKLLHWLIEHEQETLKRLIKRALDHNVFADDAHRLSTEHMRDDIFHIFMLLETLLQEAAAEDLDAQKLQRSLLPAIDQIDTAQCSPEMIAKSVARATSLAEKNTAASPKEALYRELLKQWHPAKQVVN